jgi:hypothetical protein
MVLLEKLIVTHLVKNLPFIEPQDSLPCSQEPANGSILSQMHAAHNFPTLFPYYLPIYA